MLYNEGSLHNNIREKKIDTIVSTFVEEMLIQ
jgi:hypothetical protein